MTDARPIAVVYLRRSSDKQEDSIDQQRALNVAYLEKAGYVLHPNPKKAIWAETGSGRTFDQRPIFQAMLREIEAGETVCQMLVMYRPNRFGRIEDVTESTITSTASRRRGSAWSSPAATSTTWRASRAS